MTMNLKERRNKTINSPKFHLKNVPKCAHTWWKLPGDINAVGQKKDVVSQKLCKFSH